MTHVDIPSTLGRQLFLDNRLSSGGAVGCDARHISEALVHGLSDEILRRTAGVQSLCNSTAPLQQIDHLLSNDRGGRQKHRSDHSLIDDDIVLVGQVGLG